MLRNVAFFLVHEESCNRLKRNVQRDLAVTTCKRYTFTITYSFWKIAITDKAVMTMD